MLVFTKEHLFILFLFCFLLFCSIAWLRLQCFASVQCLVKRFDKPLMVTTESTFSFDLNVVFAIVSLSISRLAYRIIFSYLWYYFFISSLAMLILLKSSNCSWGLPLVLSLAHTHPSFSINFFSCWDVVMAPLHFNSLFSAQKDTDLHKTLRYQRLVTLSL